MVNQNKSPRATIRAYCLHCIGGHRKEVESCSANDPAYHQCAFHPFRNGKKRASVKIMRQFCLQCMGGSPALVRECETGDCPIHPFRFGKNPARSGKGYFAQRALELLSKGTVNEPLSVQNQFSIPNRVRVHGKTT